MTIVQINTTCGIGSTGRICVGIDRILTAHNIRSHILCSRSDGNPQGIVVTNMRYIRRQAVKSKILGNYGFNSTYATKVLIAQLEKLQPDLVHIHNIHGHDCNLELLFSYFRNKDTKLIWTFHDCWAFTGYCPHFTMMKCEQWKNQCVHCEQYKNHSWFWDRSRKIFNKKKTLFTALNMTIVTPSQWLADLVKQSFLKDYPVKVINNGIDMSVFKVTRSDFKKRYGVENKKIILGVAFDWGISKGLDVFIELATRLSDKYQIVLVGTNDKIDKQLPNNIISIHRTQNQQELVQIYSAADVFVNPTREDNYPTVNMEALACGTPVLTFKTGGSPEILDETCGMVVDCDDVDAMENEIIRICTGTIYSERDCINTACGFDQNERFEEYLKLYERVISTGN